MAIVYIAVGSNLNQRYENVKHALELIRKESSIDLIKVSPFYETAPENIEGEQTKFLNGVWKIKTEESPEALLEILQKIEKSMGREASEKNLPRTIDLDILFYDSEIIETGKLTIPHPRLSERYFVLKPLCDIATDLRHPVTRLSSSQLLKMCQEKQSANHQESSQTQESIECA